MKKLFSLLLVMMFVLAGSANAFAAAPAAVSSQEVYIEPTEAYECQSEKVETELAPDGTVYVKEYWTFSTKRHQKMTMFEHTVPKSDKYQISDLSVSQGGGKEYKKLEAFDASRPEKSYAIQETETGYKIQAYYYIENQSITMVVSYTVKGAMQFYKDTAEFNWEFINADVPYDVEIFTGHVILPVGVDRDGIKAWTHVKQPASLTKESGELVTLSIEELNANTPVDIRIAAPLSLFPKAKTTDDTEQYLQILKEENDPEQNPAYTAREKKKDRIIQIGVPAALLVGAAAILLFNRLSGKRRKQ